MQVADDGGHAVVAQAAGVHRGWYEGVAQGIHQDDRCQAGHVAEVPCVGALGDGRAGLGLDTDDLQVGLFTLDLVLDEGEEDPGEVRAAAYAAHDDIGVGVNLLHLLHGLLSHDALVQEDVVHHAAQRVERVVAGEGVLAGLADGDAQAPRAVRVIGQYLAPDLGIGAGAGHHLGAPGLHHDTAVGLLVVAHLDHVDLELQAQHLAAQGQGAPPLAGAGLGGQALAALLLGVVGLGHGGVELVGACGAHTLVLVVDVGRGIEGPFQAEGTLERGGPPHLVDLLELLRDLDVALGAELLLVEGAGIEGWWKPGRLLGCRVAQGWQGLGEVSLDVVPGSGHLFLCQDDLGVHSPSFLVL